MTIRQTYSWIAKQLKKAIRKAKKDNDYDRVKKLKAQLNYLRTVWAIQEFVDRCD
jgi:uncharacterized membrane protein (DUF106 family)